MQILLMTALVGASFGIAVADAPAPLVQLGFNGSIENAGALGGEAEMVEYAPMEGPTYGRGVRGLAVSFAASSRCGGTTFSQAGGAVVFQNPRLAALKQFTMTAWFLPLVDGSPARLLYMPGEWDLFLGRLQPNFKLTTEDNDLFLPHPPDMPKAGLNEWNFIAISVDTEGGRIALHLAAGDGPVGKPVVWEDQPPPRGGDGTLQIGNLEGIRPFKGLMDDVRIYDRVLSESEVSALREQTPQKPRTLRDYPLAEEGAQRGLFKHSDVCFSTRWGRPNAVEAIQAFKANRVVWVYTSDAEFVASVHAAGATIQGAINSVPRTKDLSAYAVDLDGKKLVAPWMVNFSKTDPVKWGCNNQPAFREAVLKNARAALDAGVDALQFDDGALIVSAHSWGGGCMCDRCMEAFREYLKGLPPERIQEAGIEDLDDFDYRRYLAEEHDIRDAATYMKKRAGLPTTALFTDFQIRSVRSYFKKLRATLDDYAGRRVPLSINSNLQNPSQRRNYLVDIVDFLLGETWSTKLPDLAICAKAAAALGKHQIVSPFPHNVNDTRVAMAATYALGELFLVPWDVWMGAKAAERYFGTVEQYGDLYHFVREHARLFDGYETPGMVGVVLNTDRYDANRTRALVDRLLKAQMPFSFVLTGHEFYDLPLDPARLEKFELLVTLDEVEAFAAQDREVLEAARQTAPLLTDRQVGDRLLAHLSPIEVWGPDGVCVLPRISTRPDARSLVCHVLNRNQVGEEREVAPLRYVSFGLRRSGFLGSEVASAMWYAPGREPTEALIDKLPDGCRIIIPEVAEWGIVEIEFGAGGG